MSDVGLLAQGFLSMASHNDDGITLAKPPRGRVQRLDNAQPGAGFTRNPHYAMRPRLLAFCVLEREHQDENC